MGVRQDVWEVAIFPLLLLVVSTLHTLKLLDSVEAVPLGHRVTGDLGVTLCSPKSVLQPA